MQHLRKEKQIGLYLTVWARQPSSSKLLLGCHVANAQTEPAFSTKQAAKEATHKAVTEPVHLCWPSKAKYSSSKWGSFTLYLPVTRGFSSLGPGPRLIPVVLPALETEQWLGNAISASLRANSLSQISSFYLSFTIAIITCLLYTSPSPRD